ncbi:MAG: hypothetical protein ACKESB_00205 [Candidatus Hodgkinia cicadicola]
MLTLRLTAAERATTLPAISMARIGFVKLPLLVSKLRSVLAR